MALLDTGANATAINKRLVGSLGLQRRTSSFGRDWNGNARPSFIIDLDLSKQKRVACVIA